MINFEDLNNKVYGLRENKFNGLICFGFKRIENVLN